MRVGVQLKKGRRAGHFTNKPARFTLVGRTVRCGM